MTDSTTNKEGITPSSDIDFSTLSDDEIMNMPFPPLESSSTEVEEEYLSVEEETEEESTDVEEDVEDEDPEFESDDSDEVEDVEEEQSDTEEDDTDSDEDETTTDTSSNLDYESKYNELMAPFKGNGKEIKVDTPEDLRRLAQMGVGYNAKMAELKPIRKIAKMLEGADLLSEEKINFLIDLSKKDTSAINKLIKDSGINPLDIDTESTEEYKPNTYTVSDNQLALDEALDELQRSPSGQRVIDLVSNKWDQSSKQVLVSNPELMNQLNSHVNSGIYDQVSAVLERERLLGRVPPGLSDLDAYNYYGNQLAQAGKLNTPTTATKTDSNGSTQRKDTERSKRKRAAASPKSKKLVTKPKKTQILSMSDEEFEKTLMSDYM
jgi:hypothetical protein